MDGIPHQLILRSMISIWYLSGGKGREDGIESEETIFEFTHAKVVFYTFLT